MKKFLTLLLTVALTATLAITGTVAYLTDTDQDVNTMTMGSVQIDQIEQQRTENGVLEPFVQDKPALPAVGPIQWATTGVNVNGTEYKVFTDDLKNVVDKIVTVKNTGKSDAFIRTIIAIEAPEYDPTDLIHINYNGGANISAPLNVTVGGIDYVVFTFTYTEKLVPNATSAPSLMQLFLDSEATNEDCAKFGDKWEVIALSQAAQADGFADAATALNTAFGDVTANNAAEWFADALNLTTVSTVDELQKALDDDAENIVLTSNVSGELTFTQEADKVTEIEGNGNTFDGVLLVDGKSSTIMSSGLVIKNLNFDATNLPAGVDACIQLGNGTTATRYTCNVTIENCTFDLPAVGEGIVGIKSYTGGDKNLTIRNCKATGDTHSLAQLKGIDGVLIDNCTVDCIRGINFNNSTNVTVKDCTIDVDKYALRFGESSGGAGAAEIYKVTGCTIKSQNLEDDAAIVLRGTADNSTLTIENTTITAAKGTEFEIKNTATNATVIK